MINNQGIDNEINQFIKKRLENIREGQTPVNMKSGGKFILHIIPQSTFNDELKISIGEHEDKLKNFVPFMTQSGSCNHEPNLEGYLGYITKKNANKYIQIYRNGTIELCFSLNYFQKDISQNIATDETESRTEKYIPTNILEGEVVKKLQGYIQNLNDMNIDFPFFIYMSFVNVNGFKLGIDSVLGMRQHCNEALNMDVVELPRVIGKQEVFGKAVRKSDALSHESSRIAKIVKPAFDVLYNAFGLPHSNITKEGNLLK
jgi:hypothetical protein